MVWTKATFWLVANTLRGQLTTPEMAALRPREDVIVRNTITDIANVFADAFQQSNDHFDRDKFIRACGLEV